MKNGITGVELDCKLAIKFYVDVLATFQARSYHVVL